MTTELIPVEPFASAVTADASNPPMEPFATTVTADPSAGGGPLMRGGLTKGALIRGGRLI